ncbi:hypothetical protein [Actinophytocola sp. KF-1]
MPSRYLGLLGAELVADRDSADHAAVILDEDGGGTSGVLHAINVDGEYTRIQLGTRRSTRPFAMTGEPGACHRRPG